MTPDLPGPRRRSPPAPAGVTLADLADGVAARDPARLAPGRVLARRAGRPAPRRAPSRTGGHADVGQLGLQAHRRRARRRAGPAGHRGERTSRRAPRPRCSGGTTAPTSSAEQVRRTRATLLANDRDSFLNCYRVFATADAEIAADLSRISVPALADHRRVRSRVHPGDDPAARRGDPRLPSRRRAGRAAHAPRRTPPRARRPPVHLHRRERTCLIRTSCSTSSAASGSPRRPASTSRAPTPPRGSCSTTPHAATPPTSIAAVASARAAFDDPRWRDLSQTRRGHLLRRLGDLIGEHAEELARSESLDNGKLLREMRGPAGRFARVLLLLRRSGGQDPR